MRVKPAFAHKLAFKIALKYDLSYRSRVTLEATINELFNHNISMKQAERLIVTLFKNLFFINNPPMLPLPEK